jgi:hypothetical protein
MSGDAAEDSPLAFSSSIARRAAPHRTDQDCGSRRFWARPSGTLTASPGFPRLDGFDGGEEGGGRRLESSCWGNRLD